MSREKYKLFRDTQVWPLASDFNYEQWLTNFSVGEEQDIAQRILDFFIYMPDNHINQMLATVIGKCGYYFKQQRGAWSNSDFSNNCWYSFVPGEELKPTDSGYVFNRKLRDNIRIPEDRIVDYLTLRSCLLSSNNQNVILVDDFVGSGHQTWVAWTRRSSSQDKSLQEISIVNNHKVIYAPLVVNQKGYNKIINECVGLGLTFIYLLSQEYSLFDRNCPCWDGDNIMFQEGIKLIIEKSISLGIPITGGADVIDAKGYDEQGLALAFAHGMPDACPPFFYWESADWKPLVKKVYSRP